MATADVHGDEVGAKKESKGAEAGRIRCLVVTPERTTLDEPVDFAAIPLYDGELGILPGHTPLIGRLGYGTLRVKLGGAERRYFIDGGFAQLRDDVLTVLTQRAIPADQLDASAAAGELDKARSMVATTDLQREEKERAIARARAQLRTAESAT